MASAARISTDHSAPARLSSAFAGEHAWCDAKMMLIEDLADGVPLPTFFHGGGFDEAIACYAKASGGGDRRAVVSMWSLYYFAGLSIPYLLARQLAGQALPVAFDEMTIALADNGLPRAFGVPHSGVVKQEIHADGFSVVRPLLETHLAEVVSRLKAYGISAKLCWNNAAVYIDYALRLTAPGAYAADTDLPLFVRGCLPDGGMNPFCGCLQRVEENGEHIARRKVCCLRYMLPGVPNCGNLCALPRQRNA